MPRIRVQREAAHVAVGAAEYVEWVDWVDEPRHRLLWENAHARVYDARFPAGVAAATMFHRHTQDTVYACVSGPGPGGAVFSEALDLEGCGEDGEEGGVARVLPRVGVDARAGWCFCMLHRSKTYIHRALTPDGNSAPVRFVGCEVLTPTAVSNTQPLSHACYAAELAERRFRAYRLTLQPGQSTGMHRWDFSGVLMLLSPAAQLAASTGSPVAGAALHEFVWFDGPVEHELRNMGQDEALEALLVEWLGFEEAA